MRPPYGKDYAPFTGHGFTPPRIREDIIFQLDSDGKVLREISVFDIMKQNNMESILSANGQKMDKDFKLGDGGELVHLNKVAVLSARNAARFPDFDEGDLLLSMRTHNLLMVVDPNDLIVKWHQIGPWLRQHNPIFEDDGTISVFNNNGILAELDIDQAPVGTLLRSAIMRFAPALKTVETVYGNRPGQKFGTIVRGRHETTPGGGYIISEFEGGRAFEVDRNGVLIWEYVNAYDAERVAEITGAAVYPPSYFSSTKLECS